MDCLINYIGIKDCVPAPASGIYINSLPGISTQIVDMVAMKEEETYSTVWDDVNKIAARRFHADVMGGLREQYVLKTVRQSFEFIPVAGADEAASANYRGLQLDFAYQYFTFQAFTVGGVYLLARNSGTTTLKIFDRNGIELYTNDVSYVTGLNTFYVDKIFSSDRLFIGFDFTGIDGSASDISSHATSCFCQTVRSYCGDCDPSFNGATRSGSTVTTTEQNSHGVGVYGAIGCDYSSIVCNNKTLFSSAWLYLLGNQLLIQVLAADRLNKYTTADRAKFEELRDHYQVQYENQLASAVKGIHLNTSLDCCIECNSNPKSVQWLP